MQLTYRGVSYDYTPNPMPPMGPSFATGTYRGAPVTFCALQEMPAQPSEDLVWRGVPYRSGHPAPAITRELVTVTVPNPGPSAVKQAEKIDLSAVARNLFIRHHQRIRRREQGMMVRLAAEVGIPVEDAAHYESQIQGKVPHDFGGYDRSSTAMS
jgi:hypothetical protein